MKISKLGKVKTPVRGNQTDAGIDFFVPDTYEGASVGPGQSILIPSLIRVDVPKGKALVAFNKSGIAVNKTLHVGACVIDHGYQGEVHINLTNVGKYTQFIKPGAKIVQFLLLNLSDDVGVEVVDDKILFPEVSNRGKGGFGSTGG